MNTVISILLTIGVLFIIVYSYRITYQVGVLMGIKQTFKMLNESLGSKEHDL